MRIATYTRNDGSCDAPLAITIDIRELQKKLFASNGVYIIPDLDRLS